MLSYQLFVRRKDFSSMSFKGKKVKTLKRYILKEKITSMLAQNSEPFHVLKRKKNVKKDCVIIKR